jgi:hypothetical protein
MCGARETELPPGQTLEAQHVVEYQDGGEPRGLYIRASAHSG